MPTLTTIQLLADDLRLRTILPVSRVTSGSKNAVCLQVDFTSHWATVKNKTAVFFTASDKTVYEVFLVDGKCIVPHEVLANPGELIIGVRGVNPEDGTIRPSTLVKYKIEKGAPVGDGTSVEPTPDVYAQILAKLNQIQQNTSGADPEIIEKAVNEYLEKNPPGGGGAPGPAGKDGKDGIDGKDGKDGIDGKDGKDGATPAKGVDYMTPADIQEIAEQAAELVEVPDSYTRQEIDAIMGTYITDIDTLVGGGS